MCIYIYIYIYITYQLPCLLRLRPCRGWASWPCRVPPSLPLPLSPLPLSLILLSLFLPRSPQSAVCLPLSLPRSLLQPAAAGRRELACLARRASCLDLLLPGTGSRPPRLRIYIYIYIYIYIRPKDQSRQKVAWEQKLPISATLENTPKSCRSRLIWVGKSRQKKTCRYRQLVLPHFH